MDRDRYYFDLHVRVYVRTRQYNTNDSTCTVISSLLHVSRRYATKSRVSDLWYNRKCQRKKIIGNDDFPNDADALSTMNIFIS